MRTLTLLFYGLTSFGVLITAWAVLSFVGAYEWLLYVTFIAAWLGPAVFLPGALAAAGQD
jgi:hypothetical protein